MCSLSWVPDAGAYTVFFNRDERRTRLPGSLPVVHDGDVAYLAPGDGDFGGTWIGVNDRGVTIALLNRYDESPHEPVGTVISRGLLVRELLDARTLSDAHHRLTTHDLTRYRTFTLGLFGPDRPALILPWDGRTLGLEPHTSAGLLGTSSSADQAGAEAVRRALFAEVKPHRDAYEALHRDHRPARGAYSVCMHRDDAETVSFTRIDVSLRAVQMTYIAGAPCAGHPPFFFTLPRTPDRA